MATELGVAYLSLSASTKDFAKDVKAALKDVEVDAESTGKKSGSTLGAGLKKGLVAIGAGVAGVTALVAGLALKGGISRALAIEDAQAKLKGLGHSVESVQTIMDSALASVKGTAFGLGDAATVAASTVAAGVKPGADLTRTLKLVADASTIAGTSMGDMGLIFNKVASTGKIQGEVIAQLGERGIPILQLLGEQLGTSAAEVSKLASEGKVDFETFQAAMEAGMGGAALASGETFRGALANTMAALGRLGEKVISGVLPQIKDGFGSAISVLDGFAPHAERVGQVIGEALSKSVAFVKTEVIPRLKEFGAWFMAEGLPRIKAFASYVTGTVIPALQVAGQWIKQNRDWLVPLGAAILAGAAAWKVITTTMAAWKAVTTAVTAAQLALNVAMTANPIGLIIAAVVALVAGIVLLYQKNEAFRNLVQSAWAGIQAAVQAVVAWWQTYVQPVLTAVWAAITDAAAVAVAWYQQHLAPVFTAFGDLMAAVFERVATVVTWLWNTILKPYLTFMLELWSGVWSAIVAFWEKVGPPLFEVIQKAVEVFKTIWTGVWNVVRDVVAGVWNAIQIVVETALNTVKGLFNFWAAIFRGDWQGAWDAVRGIFSGTWDGIVRLAKSGVDTLGNIFGSIKETVISVFTGAGDWLKDIGGKIIDGLIAGLKGAFAKVKETLGNLTDMLPDWKGPERRDKKLLVKPGQVVMGGFIKGLESSYGDVRRTLMGLTADLPSQVSVNANPERASGNAMPAQITQTINPAPGMSEEAIGTAAARTLSFEMAGVVLP